MTVSADKELTGVLTAKTNKMSFEDGRVSVLKVINWDGPNQWERLLALSLISHAIPLALGFA